MEDESRYGNEGRMEWLSGLVYERSSTRNVANGYVSILEMWLVEGLKFHV